MRCGIVREGACSLMGSPRAPTSVSAPFSPTSAPLVFRHASQAAAEAEHVRRLCISLGFRVRVAYQRLRLGTPLTRLDKHLISVGPDLLSSLLDTWRLASDSAGAATSPPLTLYISRKGK